ncbi:hypothetical protein GE09DRAFT_690354 [Coniochaeta sp. 2T2.1]|nr:hypothetical protein GE09DRAFT_690354 [Coniochaeta sp. 2T2.1]
MGSRWFTWTMAAIFFFCMAIPIDRYPPFEVSLRSTAIYTSATVGGMDSMCHVLSHYLGAEEHGCVSLAITSGLGVLLLRLWMCV